MRPPRRTLAGLLLAAATCTGCAGGSAAAVPPPAAPTPVVSTAAPTPSPSPDLLGSRSATLDDLRAEEGHRPVAVRVPGARHPAPVEARTTDPVDGGLDLPDDASTVAWWASGSGPGDDRGSVVLAAHVNYLGQTGPFSDLADLRPGGAVVVESADGQTHRYVVRDVRSAAEDGAGPRGAVPHDRPAVLALVTCGGTMTRRPAATPRTSSSPPCPA